MGCKFSRAAKNKKKDNKITAQGTSPQVVTKKSILTTSVTSQNILTTTQMLMTEEAKNDHIPNNNLNNNLKGFDGTFDEERAISAQICNNRTCICPHCFKQKSPKMVSIGVQVDNRAQNLSSMLSKSPRALVRPSITMKQSSSSQLSFLTFRPLKMQKLKSQPTKTLAANIKQIYGRPINTTNKMGQRFSVMVTGTQNNLGNPQLNKNQKSQKLNGLLPRSHTKPIEDTKNNCEHSVTSQSDNRYRSKTIELTEGSENSEEEEDIQLSPRKIGFVKPNTLAVLDPQKMHGTKLMAINVSLYNVITIEDKPISFGVNSVENSQSQKYSKNSPFSSTKYHLRADPFTKQTQHKIQFSISQRGARSNIESSSSEESESESSSSIEEFQRMKNKFSKDLIKVNKK